MTIFHDIERRLENLFEGFFNRQFRSALQPVELAKKMAKEMDRGKVVSVDNVYAPNYFQVKLSKDDYKNLDKFLNQFISELENYLSAHAADRDYVLNSAIKIDFSPDPMFKAGQLRIETDLAEAPAPEIRGEVKGHTQIISPEEAVDLGLYSDQKEAALIHRESGKRYPINGDFVTIGRHEDNDIVVSDPSVSRYHAELIRRGPSYMIKDLNSTNGSKINQAPVKEAVLEDEDCVTIGKTDFVFRR